MALNDINSSSIGFNPEAMKTAMANIKTNFVDQTNTTLQKCMNELANDVDNAWRGASADRFKQNMQDLTTKMIATMDNYYQTLETQMSSIIKQMQDAEDSLVKGGN